MLRNWGTTGWFFPKDFPRQKWIQHFSSLVVRHQTVLLTAAAVTAVAIALAAMSGSPNVGAQILMVDDC